MENGDAGEALPFVGNFPADIPENCPPPNAVNAFGVVYRVVRNNPPLAEDFLSWKESDRFDEDRACDCFGVSVFREAGDAMQYAEKFPFLGELIARGALEAHHGKIAPTPRIIRGIPNSHATWWPFEELQRHEIFEIAAEEL